MEMIEGDCLIRNAIAELPLATESDVAELMRLVAALSTPPEPVGS